MTLRFRVVLVLELDEYGQMSLYEPRDASKHRCAAHYRNVTVQLFGRGLRRKLENTSSWSLSSTQ